MRWIRRLLLACIIALMAIIAFAAPVFALDWSNTVVVIIANPDHDSDSVPDLKYANNDYDMMLEYVRQGLKVPQSQIRSIKNADLLQFKRIFGKGRWLDTQLKKLDGANVFIYISSHGVPGRDGRGYFVPSNGLPDYSDELYARDLVVAAMRRALVLTKAKANAVFAIFDSCFSGNSYAGAVSTSKTGLPIRQIATSDGLVVFSATGGSGIAYPDKTIGLSSLTSAFLRAVADDPEISRPQTLHKDTAGIGEIMPFVATMVPILSENNQTPEIVATREFQLPKHTVSALIQHGSKLKAERRWRDLRAENVVRFSNADTPIGLERRLKSTSALLQELFDFERWCDRNVYACDVHKKALGQKLEEVFEIRLQIEDRLKWIDAQKLAVEAARCRSYKVSCERLMSQSGGAYTCLYAREFNLQCSAVTSIRFPSAEEMSTPSAAESANSRFSTASASILLQDRVHQEMMDSNTVRECDLAAGSRDHPDVATWGVASSGYGNSEIKKTSDGHAIAICRAALQEFPQSARMLFNLARALLSSPDADSRLEAFGLLEQLSDENRPAAQHLLATLYDDQRRFFRKLELLEKAAEQNFVPAALMLVDIRTNTLGMKDDEIALKYLRIAADAGHLESMYKFASLVKTNGQTSVDEQTALQYLTMAVDAGHGPAAFALARAYQHGFYGLKPDLSAMMRYDILAAKNWNAVELPLLGDNCRMAVVQLAQSATEEAISSFEDLRGSPGFSDELAELIRLCVRKIYADKSSKFFNSNLAVRWYREAAEQGDATGQFNLGRMYQLGKGVTQDYAEAVRWYRKAAEQGHASGQNSLGWMYQYGTGVRQDYAEAVKWYVKAAKQGHATGQFNLGLMYDYGNGVAKSYSEAVRWYRKAAEQGHARGQAWLGDMYENGKGVAMSKHEAMKWYRKAAEQGNDLARQALARLGE